MTHTFQRGPINYLQDEFLAITKQAHHFNTNQSALSPLGSQTLHWKATTHSIKQFPDTATRYRAHRLDCHLERDRLIVFVSILCPQVGIWGRKNSSPLEYKQFRSSFTLHIGTWRLRGPDFIYEEQCLGTEAINELEFLHSISGAQSICIRGWLLSNILTHRHEVISSSPLMDGVNSISEILNHE